MANDPGSLTAVGASAATPRRGGRLTGGGTGGNERLTAASGVLLLLLLAVLGVTILGLRDLLWLHLFVGMLLVPPVLLKMASTGYRFVRYDTQTRRIAARGPLRPRCACSLPSSWSRRS